MTEICPKDKCTGCGACISSCVHSAIKWQIDDEGFKYPIIDNAKCIDCAVCVRRCPNNKEYEPEEFEKSVFAAYSRRWQKKGSSGGVFSAFAEYVLANGGRVYGAAFHDKLKLEQTGISTIDELVKLQGSKYSQSDTADSYNDVKTDLQAGKIVLYCGTPCQIAGLLQVVPRRLQQKLLTIDFVCHGVPSQKAFDKMVNLLQIKYGIVTEFYFRLMKYQAIAPYAMAGGKTHFLKGDEYTYMEAFYKGLLFRPSCYNCQFSSIKRPADITLADFWRLKGFKAGRKYNGVSMLILNSNKGKDYFKQILFGLYFEERSLDYAVSEQHNLREPSKRPIQRDSSAKDFLSLSLHDFGVKYNLLPNNKVKNIIRFGIKMLSLKLGFFKYLNKK